MCLSRLRSATKALSLRFSSSSSLSFLSSVIPIPAYCFSTGKMLSQSPLTPGTRAQPFVRHTDNVWKFGRQVRAQDPDAVIITGDIGTAPHVRDYLQNMKDEGRIDT